MTGRYSVGSKGQVVIAKDIRDRLAIEPGWSALQRIVGDHVEVYFVPPEHRRSLRGSLAGHIKAHVPVIDWEKARRRAWKAASAERDSIGNERD